MNVVQEYVMKKIDERFHPDGYNVGININEAAGQSVFIATCTLSPDTRAMCPIQKAGLGALYQVNRSIRISVVLGFATKMEHNNGAIRTKIKIIEL